MRTSTPFLSLSRFSITGAASLSPPFLPRQSGDADSPRLNSGTYLFFASCIVWRTSCSKLGASSLTTFTRKLQRISS